MWRLEYYHKAPAFENTSISRKKYRSHVQTFSSWKIRIAIDNYIWRYRYLLVLTNALGHALYLGKENVV